MAALDLHKKRGKSELACITKKTPSNLYLLTSVFSLPSDKQLSFQLTSSSLFNWQTTLCLTGKQSSLQRTSSPLSNGQAVLSPIDEHFSLPSPEHVQERIAMTRQRIAAVQALIMQHQATCC